MWTVVGKERSMTAAFFFGQYIYFCFIFSVRLNGTRLSQYLTALNIFTLNTTKKAPMLSPATAESNNLRNISTPVTTTTSRFFSHTNDFDVSPTLISPRSTRPVATVPRPVIVNTSSTGIRKGLSVHVQELGYIHLLLSINSNILPHHSHSRSAQPQLRALTAEPLTTGISSPGNS